MTNQSEDNAMTDWKEQPHLFANGKFKALTVGGVQEIQGYQTNFHCQDDIYEEHVLMLSDGDIMAPKQCTLIARPIEDMTHEELHKAMHLGFPDVDVFGKEDIEYAIKVSSELLLYLLSIGVYPFNQSHFDDGTVLNINEV